MANIILMLVAAWSVSVLAAERPDVVIEDFEGPDYGKWKVEGEAFGPGPAHGTLPNQMQVSGCRGQGPVNSYYKGDKSTGKLTCPPIKIERRFINFLIGGGKNPEKLYLGLLIGGKKVRTASGPNDQPGGSEALDWESWDVSEFEGREAVLVIVDNATGGWGHINVDQITQSDHKREEQRIIEQRELEKLIITTELYNETYRPQFLFIAKKNWLNDPNGLVFYKGEYHLFFQHNPDGINWGNMTWGHAVSKDLVHWEQLEHAIHPDNLGTIFSGSAVVDWKNTTGFQSGEKKALVCIYTSAGKPLTQSIAYSNVRGRTLTKYEKNPVLPHFVGGNRDPKVIWHEPTQKWIMALYKDKSLYALFFSPDLKTWTFLHDLDMPGCGECPDLFPMPVDGDRKNIKWVWTLRASFRQASVAVSVPSGRNVRMDVLLKPL